MAFTQNEKDWAIDAKKRTDQLSLVNSGVILTLLEALEDYIYVLGADDIEINQLLIKIYGKMRANNLNSSDIVERLKKYYK